MLQTTPTLLATLRAQVIETADSLFNPSAAVLRTAAERLEEIARQILQQAENLDAANRTETNSNEPISVWTDGACSGNPGPGGWAVVIAAGAHTREIVGGADSTTNNVMELEAILAAVDAVPTGAHVRLYTDSQNAIGWLSQGWKRRDPKIADICERITSTILAKSLQITYVKAVAHQDDPMNNRADALAAAEAQRRRTRAAA